MTQFCFEAAPILSCAERLRAQGIARAAAGRARRPGQPAHACGNTRLHCGIGNSIRALGTRVDAVANLLARQDARRASCGAGSGAAAGPGPRHRRHPHLHVRRRRQRRRLGERHARRGTTVTVAGHWRPSVWLAQARPTVRQACVDPIPARGGIGCSASQDRPGVPKRAAFRPAAARHDPSCRAADPWSERDRR